MRLFIIVFENLKSSVIIARFTSKFLDILRLFSFVIKSYNNWKYMSMVVLVLLNGSHSIPIRGFWIASHFNLNNSIVVPAQEASISLCGTDPSCTLFRARHQG